MKHSPRSKQRFPRGGKELYELMRMDHEPIFVSVYRSDEVARDRHKMRDDSLVYESELDPMLYFWPVEGQHVIAFIYSEIAEDARERLARALLRDGARWVSISWRNSKNKFEAHSWGDTDGFMRDRYEPGDAVAVSGGGHRGDGEGARASPASGSLFSDGERQDSDRLEVDPAGPRQG
jgi:hypothetical protein